MRPELNLNPPANAELTKESQLNMVAIAFALYYKYPRDRLK